MLKSVQNGIAALVIQAIGLAILIACAALACWVVDTLRLFPQGIPEDAANPDKLRVLTVTLISAFKIITYPLYLGLIALGTLMLFKPTGWSELDDDPEPAHFDPPTQGGRLRF